MLSYGCPHFQVQNHVKTNFFLEYNWFESYKHSTYFDILILDDTWIFLEMAYVHMLQ